jgi:RNA polymerase sigma factor for flagellar operon FliA
MPTPPQKRPPIPSGNGDVQRRLVEDHIAFVRSIARKLREQMPVIEMDDLVGFGMQGLLEAAQRFDDRHGVAFTTFAYYRVRGAMFDGLRSMGWLPRGEYSRLRQEEQANAYLENTAARAPQEDGGTAEAGGQVVERVREISSTLHGIATVFVTLFAREQELRIADDRPTAPQLLEEHQLCQRVRAAMQRLPDKEKTLLELYYFQDLTLEQAGGKMGLSKSWTSRLHARAITLLRELLVAEGVV